VPRTPLIATAAAALAAALLASAGLAAETPPAGTSCPGADEAPPAGTSVASAATVLCLVGAERDARGLPRLRDDPRLRRAAADQAKALTASGGAPRSSATSTQRRISATGYARGRGFAYGEALGHAAARSSTPAARVRGWLRNGPTRRLLLSHTFRDAGAAVRTVRGRTVFVLELAGPVRKRR
jgi:uncharacterized protein YkwD